VLAVSAWASQTYKKDQGKAGQPASLFQGNVQKVKINTNHTRTNQKNPTSDESWLLPRTRPSLSLPE